MESQFKIEKLNNDIFLTPEGGYDKVLIWMHGLGDSAEGFFDFFVSYPPIPDKMRVVLLTAPKAAVTINGGMVMNSWYDIKSFNKNDDFVEESDVVKNSIRVNKVIETEVQNVDGNYSKIFLGGFSQGGCMTLHLGISLENKLGGLITLSGCLFPFTAKILEKDLSKKELPIFLGHGKYDEIIPEPLSKASYKPLFEKGFTNVEYHSYEEQHSIAAQEVDDMKKFLNKFI